MSDLTDDELQKYDARAEGMAERASDFACVKIPAAHVRGMVAEIRRHRARVDRLDAWAALLAKDTLGSGNGTGVGAAVAAELRRRMDGGG